MRIAVDARELLGYPTGVGRYVDEVLRAWAESPEGAAHTVILCAHQPLPSSVAGRPRTEVVIAPSDRGGAAWEQFVLPRLVRQAGADVLFAPAYSAPLSMPVPTVVAIHDISFTTHPEWFGWREGARRRTLTRLAATRATRVTTVSDFSKHEIVTHLGVAPSRVRVVHNGFTRPPQPAQAVAREAGRVLYVGSVFNRRHVPALIDAIGLLARTRPEVRLDVVGENRTLPAIDLAARAGAAGVAHAVRLRSWVPDDELATAYASARAFAFLSEYEGFGLTPLEAMAAGVPPVVLDTPVAREIYGDAALLVARPEPRMIADALERALFDEPTRARFAAAATTVLGRFSWTETARQLLALLVESAAEGRHA